MDFDRLLVLSHVQRKLYYNIIYLLIYVSLRGLLTSSLASPRCGGKSWPPPTSCIQPVSALSRSVSHIMLYKSERIKGKTLQYRDKTIKSASTELTSWSVQAEQTVGEQSWSFCVVTEVEEASQADHEHLIAYTQTHTYKNKHTYRQCPFPQRVCTNFMSLM